MNSLKTLYTNISEGKFKDVSKICFANEKKLIDQSWWIKSRPEFKKSKKLLLFLIFKTIENLISDTSTTIFVTN